MTDITSRIQGTLQEIASGRGVRILYACESGSRAWEFASADSDYDVRFLYVRPTQAYLKLDTPRDVIELPLTDELDVNGWDIIKALRLMRKGNPPLLEWLYSPIVYQENSPAIAQLREIGKRMYAMPAIFYHYRHMAYGNYHQYIENRDQVPLKKYLYVLRPIVALLYIEECQAFPGTSFLRNLDSITLDSSTRQSIDALITRKMAGDEMGLSAPDPQLNAFVDHHLARWEKITYPKSGNSDLTQQLDQILQGILDDLL
jgi:predicted nucleotidyltransferase